MSSFGASLRQYRLRRGWSQNAFAQLAHRTSSYINRLESGKRGAPTRATTLALAQALELASDDVDQLLGSAGYLPLSLQLLDPADTTVRAVVRLLTDERLSPGVLTDFRAVVETIASRWQRQQPADPARGAARGAGGSRQASRPTGAASLPVPAV